MPLELHEGPDIIMKGNMPTPDLPQPNQTHVLSILWGRYRIKLVHGLPIRCISSDTSGVLVMGYVYLTFPRLGDIEHKSMLDRRIIPLERGIDGTL